MSPFRKDLGFPIGLFYHTHASRLHLFLFIHFLSLQDKWDRGSLHWASRLGYLAIVILLLAAGANVDKQANNGKTFILAAQYGYIEVVKELLKAGANKKLKANNGETAYDRASKEEIKAALLR